MQPHLLIWPNKFQIRTLFWIARWRALLRRPARENRLRLPVNLSLQSLSFPFMPVPHFSLRLFRFSRHSTSPIIASLLPPFLSKSCLLSLPTGLDPSRLARRPDLRPFCFDVRAIPWIFFNRIFGIIYYPNGKLGRVFIIFHIFRVSSSHIVITFSRSMTRLLSAIFPSCFITPAQSRVFHSRIFLLTCDFRVLNRVFFLVFCHRVLYPHPRALQALLFIFWYKTLICAVKACWAYNLLDFRALNNALRSHFIRRLY